MTESQTNPADLYAIAEIAHYYLFSGAADKALTLYDGLAAMAPDVAYFALGLGLAHDRTDSKTEALRWYRRAAELDPGDGRADVNRAELYLAAGDRIRASKLLTRGLHKAQRAGDGPLAHKAALILERVSRAKERIQG